MAYTTIDDPTLHFEVLTWSGDGNNTRNITGLDFQPDLSWKKERNQAFSIGNMWYDSVRGLGVNKHIDSTSTAVEGNGNDETYGYYTGFISGGFSVQGGSADKDYVNKSGHNYVAWNWLGGGSASSNSDGSITTSVSANTTAGFSIVTYTLGSGSGSTTHGHGLGAVPHVIINKSLDQTYNWQVYHHKNTSAPETDRLLLNDNNATSDDNRPWNDTAPTSSVFSHGDSSFNGTGDHVSYCYTEKKGYSKFGSYTGNGNADGPFVYTGFKPAWVMIKDTTTGGTGHGWIIFDNKRNTFNPTQALLLADVNDTEYTITDPIDFLSNGFKIRDTNQSRNDNGSTYIYMAFAESPFVNSNGVPNNAK
jgi:hypothetical protein